MHHFSALLPALLLSLLATTALASPRPNHDNPRISYRTVTVTRHAPAKTVVNTRYATTTVTRYGQGPGRTVTVTVPTTRTVTGGAITVTHTSTVVKPATTVEVTQTQQITRTEHLTATETESISVTATATESVTVTQSASTITESATVTDTESITVTQSASTITESATVTDTATITDTATVTDTATETTALTATETSVSSFTTTATETTTVTTTSESAAQCTNTSPLRDPGFDKLAEYWDFSTSTAGGTLRRASDSNARSGILVLWSSLPASINGVHMIRQAIAVCPGATYRFSAWTRQLSATSQMIATFVINGNLVARTTAPVMAWTEVTGTWTAPLAGSGAALFGIQFSGPTAVTRDMIVDDVVLQMV
ncbi:hypothetical protein BZA05DRAFT_386146 [Tricharina praecox]|uniref:uncharacterized protein n=1 Tax=Tricharina praecox TaxID=43433 RepID=UPI00222102F0|nr:uncharacterized protein BZA05DRAFT_386146 [Tricharina praecox]KAI5858157.1 hypothetical protein BZA05DRAFT_386146 [Tricharina praecox]